MIIWNTHPVLILGFALMSLFDFRACICHDFISLFESLKIIRD